MLAAIEVLQAGLILVAYSVLVGPLGDRAAVVSYALATFVVSAATLVLVVRTHRPSREPRRPSVSATFAIITARMRDSSRPLEAPRRRIDDLGRKPVILASIAVALLIPIILFTFAGFQVGAHAAPCAAGRPLPVTRAGASAQFVLRVCGCRRTFDRARHSRAG